VTHSWEAERMSRCWSHDWSLKLTRTKSDLASCPTKRRTAKNSSPPSTEKLSFSHPLPSTTSTLTAIKKGFFQSASPSCHWPREAELSTAFSRSSERITYRSGVLCNLAVTKVFSKTIATTPPSWSSKSSFQCFSCWDWGRCDSLTCFIRLFHLFPWI
jgi:hypothetical protein